MRLLKRAINGEMMATLHHPLFPNSAASSPSPYQPISCQTSKEKQGKNHKKLKVSLTQIFLVISLCCSLVLGIISCDYMNKNKLKFSEFACLLFGHGSKKKFKAQASYKQFKTVEQSRNTIEVLHSFMCRTPRDVLYACQP